MTAAVDSPMQSPQRTGAHAIGRPCTASAPPGSRCEPGTRAYLLNEIPGSAQHHAVQSTCCGLWRATRACARLSRAHRPSSTQRVTVTSYELRPSAVTVLAVSAAPECFVRAAGGLARALKSEVQSGQKAASGVGNGVCCYRTGELAMTRLSSSADQRSRVTTRDTWQLGARGLSAVRSSSNGESGHNDTTRSRSTARCADGHPCLGQGSSDRRGPPHHGGPTRPS